MGQAQKIGCSVAGCVVLGTLVIIGGLIFIGKSIKPTPPPQPKDLVKELRPAATAGTPAEGLAIAVLLDTSGSMSEEVSDKNQQMRPKLQIAKEVAQKTFDEIGRYSSENPDKKVEAALLRFSDSVSVPVNMGKVDQAVVRTALEGVTASGDTAIGDAIVFAKKQLNQAGLKKNFIILITDGENTTGTPPLPVMEAMKLLPAEQQPGTYLVAFDVRASVFKSLQEQGAMVLEAKNAVDLQAALDYVLYEKILVEQPSGR